MTDWWMSLKNDQNRCCIFRLSVGWSHTLLADKTCFADLRDGILRARHHARVAQHRALDGLLNACKTTHPTFQSDALPSQVIDIKHQYHYTHTHTDDALCPNLIACNNIFTMSNMQHEALQTSQQMSDDIAVLCGGIDPCRPPTESAFLTSMSMTLWTLNMSSQLPRNCIQFSVS